MTEGAARGWGQHVAGDGHDTEAQILEIGRRSSSARQAAVDAGQAEGTTTAAAREIRELKRKNAELEQTVEILKAATSFFVRESDPRHR